MKILSLLPTAIITLTITSGSVRVHKDSSKFKRSFNKIFLKKWNSKKNFKILFKEFGEGTKEVKISWINENLVDSKKAAKKAAKKLINDEFKEMLSLAKKLYKEKIEFVRQKRGVYVFISHPGLSDEKDAQLREELRRFVMDKAISSNAWITTLDNIYRFWRGL